MSSLFVMGVYCSCPRVKYLYYFVKRKMWRKDSLLKKPIPLHVKYSICRLEASFSYKREHKNNKGGSTLAIERMAQCILVRGWNPLSVSTSPPQTAWAHPPVCQATSVHLQCGSSLIDILSETIMILSLKNPSTLLLDPTDMDPAPNVASTASTASVIVSRELFDAVCPLSVAVPEPV